MKKLLQAILPVIVLTRCLYAQLNITTLDTDFTVDFDSSIAGVNSGIFSGSGFASNPLPGQIDSDGLIVTGMSDGDLDFGSSGISADYAQGESSGGAFAGGVYAFRLSAQNIALGLQPTESDWTPGGIILKVANATGGPVNTFEINYNIYTFNDQDRASLLQFYYSSDNSNYINASALDYTTIRIKEISPSWNVVLKTLKISAEIQNGGNLYLKWAGSDAAGSGSRDEIALDDISVAAHYEDLKVFISEVADNASSNEEYVEFFNGGSGYIDIEGWRLIERYNPDNSDFREITFTSGSQKNSGGSGYLNLTVGEFAVVVRNDHTSLKTNYSIGDDVAIFENFWPPAMTGDERYMLVNALGDVIDYFGEWEYADESSFRLAAGKCYERINFPGDGRLEDNWTVSDNTVYNYTPGSVNITPLPVELAGFYARIKNDMVILYWQTAAEINNYGFDVERCRISDHQFAAEEQSDWEVTGFVPGHGNSHSPKYYSFIDYPDKSKDHLYRLKQINVNGEFEYSKSIEVSFPSDPKHISLCQNYPNPFNPFTTINFSLPDEKYARLIIYNLLGEKVSELFRGTVIPGKIYSLEFNGMNLPSGIYYYAIETAGNIISKKMIIMK